MFYSTAIKTELAGKIPKRAKYTMKDVNETLRKAKDTPHEGKQLTALETVFIVICMAVKHNAEWTKSIDDFKRKLPEYRSGRLCAGMAKARRNV